MTVGPGGFDVLPSDVMGLAPGRGYDPIAAMMSDSPLTGRSAIGQAMEAQGALSPQADLSDVFAPTAYAGGNRLVGSTTAAGFAKSGGGEAFANILPGPREVRPKEVPEFTFAPEKEPEQELP